MAVWPRTLCLGVNIAADGVRKGMAVPTLLLFQAAMEKDHQRGDGQLFLWSP